MNLIQSFKDYKFDFLIKSPEKILPLTFFALCIFGSILLFLPFSNNGGINFIDSLFMSVSAVCVTGLSVFDITKTLTPMGQFILLVLVQTGGLGIMSISSIVFILLGKRMSLSHEKTAKNIFDAESKEEIKESIILIFKYTFISEFIGAIILAVCFLTEGKNLIEAVCLGIYTAVSAFCNAGFFLNTNNLMGYYDFSAVLYTVSFLIILGGLSPMLTVMIYNVFKKKKLPPVGLIVLWATIILLLFGSLFFMISESKGILDGMTFFEKFGNAWFQSASARTAGFNSVDLSKINAGTYILMLFLMIAGGSPGGTAGGIKTTTLGVLFLTAYNALRGRKNIIRNRRITPQTLHNAIGLVSVYFAVLIILILMLLTTQNIGAKELIFEAVSALGTVGLSMGITPELDGVGKIIIIAGMFLGRTMPATLICYLNGKNYQTKLVYPDAKISLT